VRSLLLISQPIAWEIGGTFPNPLAQGGLGPFLTIEPTDVPRYNIYTAARITGQPAAGYSSGQAIVAMQSEAAEVLPEDFEYE
jgi:hypothetical protein